MFGSSEDRARQLAARKRRERIGSSGSQSSHRSTISSNYANKQLQYACVSEQSSQRVQIPERHDLQRAGLTAIDQHTAGEPDAVRLPHDHKIPLLPLENSSLRLAREKQHPAMEQHRIQAEYLSQVLYSNASIFDMQAPPQSQFSVPTSTKRYGSLGSNSNISQQLSNMTTPVSHTQPSSSQPACIQPKLGVTTLPPLQQSEYGNHLRVHTVVSLRGGGLDNGSSFASYESRQQGNQTLVGNANYTPSFVSEFSWAGPLSGLASWSTPICSGEEYRIFLETLSNEQLERFQTWFRPGPLRIPMIHTSVALKLRKCFYQTLIPVQRLLLKNFVHVRGMELLERKLREDAGIVQRQDDPSAVPCDPSMPPVLLQHLLDAIDDPIDIPIQSTSSDLFHPALRVLSRRTSAPNLGQQQMTQQWYHDFLASCFVDLGIDFYFFWLFSVTTHANNVFIGSTAVAVVALAQLPLQL